MQCRTRCAPQQASTRRCHTDRIAQFWDFGGDAYVDTNKYIRLTQDRGSQAGWLWTRAVSRLASAKCAWGVGAPFALCSPDDAVRGIADHMCAYRRFSRRTTRSRSSSASTARLRATSRTVMGECCVHAPRGGRWGAPGGSSLPACLISPAPGQAADRSHTASRCGSRRSARRLAQSSARKTTSLASASCSTPSPTRDMCVAVPSCSPWKRS